MKQKAFTKKADIERVVGYLTFAVFVIQISYLLIFNLIFMQKVIDFDSSSMMLLAREMGKQGTLFPKDYGYQTTLDLHGMTILTSILYRVIGNIRIAQGIANDIIILVFVYLLYCVLRRTETAGAMKNLAAILYFVPWTTGQLGYMRMTFLAGAFYTHRLIIPVLIISIILDQEKNIELKKYIGRFIYMVPVCFITCLSSGPYTLLCSIAPVIAYELVRCFCTDDYSWVKTKRFVTEIIALAASAAGVVAAKAVDFVGHGSQMNMINSTRMMENISSCIIGIFGLLGGTVDTKDISLGSVQSVYMIVGVCFTLLLLVSLIYCSGRMIKKKDNSFLSGYALFLVFVNLAVYFLVDTRYASDDFEYRYHIITLGLAFFVFAGVLNDIREYLKVRQYYIVVFLVLTVIGLMLLMGDAKLLMYNRKYNIDEMKQINSFLEDNNIGTAIVCGNGDNDQKMGRTLRPYSESVLYLPMKEDLKDTGLVLWGGPKRGLDNAEQTGRVAFVTKEEYLDRLPEYITDRLTYKNTFESYSVYFADESFFDFEAGLNAREDSMIDFPYTPGYVIVNGVLNPNGELESSGAEGELIKADYSGVEGNWEYDVIADIECGKAEVKLYSNGELIADSLAEPGAGSICLKDISLNGGEKLSFIVHEAEGTKINIKKIVMKRIVR